MKREDKNTNAEMSYAQLRTALEAETWPGKGKKEPLARVEVGDTEIAVYDGGQAVCRREGTPPRVTRFSLDGNMDCSYRFVNGEHTEISKEELSKMPWMIPVLLRAEQRYSGNQERTERRYRDMGIPEGQDALTRDYSYSTSAEQVLIARENQRERTRKAREVFSAMTERERSIISLSYLGKTPRSDYAVADILGISRQRVDRVKTQVRNRLKNFS